MHIKDLKDVTNTCKPFRISQILQGCLPYNGGTLEEIEGFKFDRFVYCLFEWKCVIC